MIGVVSRFISRLILFFSRLIGVVSFLRAPQLVQDRISPPEAVYPRMEPVHASPAVLSVPNDGEPVLEPDDQLQSVIRIYRAKLTTEA